MRYLARLSSATFAGSLVALGLALPASALALPEQGATTSMPSADTAVQSIAGRTSLPKRGSWAKVYPERPSCIPLPGETQCDYEEEDVQQPDIPDVKSPIGPLLASTSAQISDVSTRSASVSPKAVAMVLKKEVDSTTSGSVPLDTSVAAAGTKIVYVQNSQISVSADSGATFSTPRTVSTLYSDSPDGGVCCDMIVNYSSSIDRFVWITQYRGGSDGKNRYRLAVFPPSAVTSTGITSWIYWDITAAHLPGTPGFLDFPDLSFGSKYLYLNFKAGDPGAGTVYKADNVRIGLVNLRDGLNLASGTTAWRFYMDSWVMGAVAQNTGSRAYWAYNTSTSSINVGWWDESSTSVYPTHSITTYTWPNSDYTSTYSGDQWLNTKKGYVLGGLRVGDNLYWAWAAGRGSGDLAWLKQPHVQFLTIKGANSGTLALSAQRALWNPDYAIAYPNVNLSGSDIGLTFAVGGGTMIPRSGIMDITATPTTYMSFTTGTASCNCGRWGDYAAIRPWANYGKGQDSKRVAFIASGYSIHKVTLQDGSTPNRQVGAVAAITN